ncbi:7181_t:CDS:1 [Dentiscutata erythropus]|uniref:7181_t:CDS:1 n=1 Tax=Dentiscutata erythropus TaxID=1348616 RepID=A0A9N8YWI6_9GLOM|nr:7181_t:CDS:1 [Dentiscutata erythropus]
MLYISSVQSKRDRIQMLLSKYIEDIITINKDHNTQFYKKVVWKLGNKLINTFQLSNQETHELFKDSKEINKVEFSLIATCYTKGIKKLNSIYNQEILKTEKKISKAKEVVM